MMADRAKAAAFDKAAAEERRKNEAAAGGMDSASSRCHSVVQPLLTQMPLQWTRTSSTSRTRQ
jgi:hypothetical protein